MCLQGLCTGLSIFKCALVQGHKYDVITGIVIIIGFYWIDILYMPVVILTSKQSQQRRKRTVYLGMLEAAVKPAGWLTLSLPTPQFICAVNVIPALLIIAHLLSLLF